MKHSFLHIILFSICLNAFSQPSIQWQKSLGGPGNDFGTSIAITSDGGYIVTGGTYAEGGDVSGFKGLTDFWVAKLDSAGSLQWQKCLGGTETDQAYWVEQTSDGGYILTGVSASTDGDVTGSHGGEEVWVVKLGADGSLQWQKSLGGSMNEGASTIRQTSDGGYIVGGLNSSSDGDATECKGLIDLWLIKLDANGSIVWQKSYGGSDQDNETSLEQTPDGGYIVAGVSASMDGDVSGNHGLQDGWILKLNSAGNIQWKKCIGGSAEDMIYSVSLCSDGSYVIAGQTYSSDGDVSGHHGQWDAWVCKLDSSGNLLWQKCLGGTSDDAAENVRQTADGGYMVAGRTASLAGDVSGKHGGIDLWLVKLDGNGSIQWQKCYGGNSDDIGTALRNAADQGWVLAASSLSNNMDVSGNHGQYDIWVVKLAPGSTEVEDAIKPEHFTLFPNPAKDRILIKTAPEMLCKSFAIYSALGKKVLEGIIQSEETELQSDFTDGIYRLCIEGELPRSFAVQKN